MLLTETLIVCPNSTQLSKFSSIGFVHCAAQFTLTSIASITNSIFKYFLIKFFICVISKYIKSVLHNVYKKETPWITILQGDLHAGLKKETLIITRLQGFFIVELVGFEPTS